MSLPPSPAHPVRFFCGVQATGRGHLSRFSVVKQILENAGCEVYGFASGQEMPKYDTGITHFRQGPTFFTKNNKIDALGSFMYNARRAPSFLQTVGFVKRTIREGGFSHAILDFEPLSVRAVRQSGIPFTIFDNQTFALLSAVDKLPGVEGAVKIMRNFVKRYYGRALHRAHQVLTYSLVPAQAELPAQIIIPPCVRNEVANLQTTSGEHILFYSSVGEVPAGLIRFAQKNPTIEVRAYVARAGDTSNLPQNIVLPNRDSADFLSDLASCRVLMTGAGFESVAEATFLRKPVLVVPIGGQWEQRINAALVKQYGIGEAAQDWSAETFELALRHDRPPSDEVRDWVLQGRPALTRAIEQTAAMYMNQ